MNTELKKQILDKIDSIRECYPIDVMLLKDLRVLKELVERSDRPIITLCGSTRFKNEYEKWNRHFTLRNFVVLSCGVFNSPDITKEQKEDLDRLHLEKIRISDYVFIINKGGYIGESTRKEIEYAERLGKEILYLEDCK